MKTGALYARFLLTFLPLLGASCASTVGPTASPAPREAVSPEPPPVAARPRVVGYAPNWIYAKAYPESIAYEKLTHLNLAFENPVNAEGDLSFSKISAALQAQAQARGVKVLVSVGGGAASEQKVMRERWFSLIGPARRQAFAAKLLAYVEKLGLDGIDLDLEGPAINADFAPFVAELAPLFQKSGKLLTAALSPGYGGGRVPKECLARFDFVNLMAYNATGPWRPKSPGPHASLEFARSNVAWWTGQGLPKDRAVLGVPFYGQGFGKDAPKGDQGFPYRWIVEKHAGAEHSDKAGNILWYNGLPTIRAKCELVRNEELGGIMIWSLDQDAAGDKSLLRAIHETLTAPAPKSL